MREPIISVSGLRGIVGETLTPDVASRYVCAFASQIKQGPLIVTRDGRATGRMLADVVRSALMAVGRDVIDADVAATPTTGVLVQQLGAAGAIQISASHNPPEYNGLKLFGDEGRVISAAAGQPVLELYRSGKSPAWVTHEKLGRLTCLEDTLTVHCRKILETVDVGRIRDQRFKVLLDSNHGAGSLLGMKILNELGCDVVALGNEPDGLFEHTPEPTAENLKDVSARVKAEGVVLGLCQDPDADRLALIDANGNYVGEEYTLALIVRHVLSQQKGPIVTNCSTSRMSEDLANEFEVPFFRSKVGEANVTELMIEKGAVFGGEGNGGPIDPRVGFVRDSFVGMAQVLDAMAARGMTLAELIDELPKYAIHKTKTPVDGDQLESTFDRLVEGFADAAADRMDGLRLDWPGRWLLVRASNTEPIVRLVAEAPSAEEAKSLCDQAATLIE